MRWRGTHDGYIFRVLDTNGRTSGSMVIGLDRLIVVYWVWVLEGRTKGCLVICLYWWIGYWGVWLVLACRLVLTGRGGCL